MRGRMGKLGILMLTLVFAIGAMGAAFASWTDTLVIEGDVTTGSLGYEVCGFSETWIYKVIAEPSDYGVLGDLVDSDEPLDDDTLLYIASADWTDYEPGMLDECIPGPGLSFEVAWDNLFPCPQFCADIIFHYTGSVPAKLSPEMEWGEGSEWLEELFLSDEASMMAYLGEMVDGEIVWGEEPVELEGLQVEYCDYIMLVWCIHIPQDNTLMNQEASFTATVNMVQWNEYEAPVV